MLSDNMFESSYQRQDQNVNTSCVSECLMVKKKYLI